MKKMIIGGFFLALGFAVSVSAQNKKKLDIRPIQNQGDSLTKGSLKVEKAESFTFERLNETPVPPKRRNKVVATPAQYTRMSAIRTARDLN